jgi:hypothetical protein
MNDHQRDQLRTAAFLLARMDELNEEMLLRHRPMEEIRAESCHLQSEWKAIMDELRDYRPRGTPAKSPWR